MSNIITVGGTMLGAGNTDRVWITGNPNYSNCPDTRNTEPGSNWGTAVKIWAPAANIISAHITSDTATRPAAHRAGTSFAAAFVAGVAARYLQAASKSALWPAHVLAYLQNNATAGVLDTDGLHGGPNLLLYAPYACRF